VAISAISRMRMENVAILKDASENNQLSPVVRILCRCG
jgi:hypothetical protein